MVKMLSVLRELCGPVLSPSPHSKTGWSHARVLHGPERCAVVSLNKQGREDRSTVYGVVVGCALTLWKGSRHVFS